jgi:signal transduction histidine kinase
VGRDRTARLNRALHELRRPVQALLLLEGESSVPAASPPGATRRGLLELAVAALEELDREVNGGSRDCVRRRVCGRSLMLAAVERWRHAAEQPSRVSVFWDAGPAYMEADPIRIAAALDNLLVNSLEHGRGPLVITGARVSERLRITIANRDRRSGGSTGTPAGSDPRRGHGLPVVSEVAREHGGRFAFYRSDEGWVAALELPLAETRVALAA